MKHYPDHFEIELAIDQIERPAEAANGRRTGYVGTAMDREGAQSACDLAYSGVRRRLPGRREVTG